ncbi:carboxymuconolactone decarboxylase family protein [Solicola sp. PLA-1-18]|uniref:carboxymuconolactone decarboxylase family protein n=1 Tax=Solicola sp. PLA-1-18 TaxID=3380532 RepID=UPI003B7FCA1A
MSRRLEPHRPVDLDDAQRRVYEAVAGGRRAQGPQAFPLTDDDGSLRGPFDAFLLSPPVGHALQELGAAVRFGSGLTDRVREIAILAVAARERCAFERQAHEAVGRTIGLDDAQLQALADESDPAGLDDHETAALTLVRSLLDGDVDEHTWVQVAGVLGERTVFELTTVVGYYRMLALQLRVFRVDDA